MFQHSPAATQSGNALDVSHVLRGFLSLLETSADCNMTGVGQPRSIDLVEGEKKTLVNHKVELWWMFAHASGRRRRH